MLKYFYTVLYFIILSPLMLFAQFAGGSGTETDPWLIRTPENLDSIRYYLGNESNNKCFKQIADIDLGIAPWNEGAGWEPIGRDSILYVVFKGSYDGNCHKIINIFINRPDEDYIGLFGLLYEPAITGLSLINVNITGGNKVGAIAGYTDFAGFTKCFITGNITGKNEIGGLIGSCNGISIFNSWCSVNVSGMNYVGGFIGKTPCIPYTFIYKSYSKGIVAGTENTGGLIGYSDSPSMAFSYWDFDATGQSVSAGGEGRTTEEMTYAFSDNTYKYWDFTNIWTEDFQNINNGYPFLQNQLSKLLPSAPNNLTASSQNGEFSVELTWNNPDTLLNGDPITELSAIYVYRNFDLIYTINNPIAGNPESYTDIVSATGNYTYKAVGVNSQGYGINARIDLPAGELFADGAGTETDPYLVSTADQLNNVRYFTDRDSVYFKQTDTIDLGVAPWNEGKGWIPIGHDESPFMGYYEGYYIDNVWIPNIHNIFINDSTLYNASLFGVTTKAEIDNIHLEGVNIYGKAGCGALVGTSIISQITACSAEGTVTGVENEIGGLIGASLRDSILYCFSDIAVSGYDHIGGLIGLTLDSTRVNDCYSKGNVTGRDYIGGFIGTNYSSLSIENSYSIGNVSGNNFLGGFTGTSDLSAIHCYWNIETSGQITSACGEGRGTFEMSVQYSDSTYVGWDFTNIWDCESYHYGWGYPYLTGEITSIEDNCSIPNELVLSQNYPNPFNPVTKISYSLPQGFAGEVKLSIYNANGQFVKELVNEKKSSGIYSVEFNSEGLNSGMYFYRLKTANSDISKKMILLK